MKKAWNAWKKIALKIGDFQASVFFSFFYYVLITPIGILLRLNNDYLNTTRNVWKDYEVKLDTLDDMKKQS